MKPSAFIRVFRRFDVTAEQVFDAWLDPKSAGRWLFATPTGKMLQVDIDARAGEGFTIVEQRGDTKAAHTGKYIEIDRPRRLVFTFGGPGLPDTFVTVQIKPAKNGCELTLTHENVWVKYGERTQTGWAGILEGLREYLAKVKDEGAYEREFVIMRVFNAPRERVWQAWTVSQQVAQWWGPMGFTNPLCELDVHPGGAIRIDMCGPDAVIYPMTGVFQEIVEPLALVFTSAALNKNSKPVFEVLNTVTFVKCAGKTEITLHANVTKETSEAAPYLKGMREGWNQSLDRLACFLK